MMSTSPPLQQPSDALELEKRKSEHDHQIPPSDVHEQEQKPEPESGEVPKPDPPTSQDKKPEWITGYKLFTVMAALTFVGFLMLLDSSIVVTAVPRITNDFRSLHDVGWYGSAYQLGSAVLQPLTGRIYMKFKAKWTFLAFFFVFEVGSLICAVATSSNMLIVGRAIAGMGTSGILNGIMIIIAECAPMEKRPSLIGFSMGFAQIGLVSGPLFGGLLTQYASWRWCFYINLPIGGIIALMLIFVRIPEQFPRPPPMTVIRSLPTYLDLIGFAIFAPAAIMLLLALQYGGNTFAWDSAQIIGLFCGAGATFIFFLAWNFHKGDAALIPFSMIRKRIVWSSCLVYGFFMSQLYTASYWVPIYFQGVKGASPTLSGVYILPMIISHIFAAMSSGPILNKVGYYVPISLFAAVLISVGSGLISTFSPGTSTGKWIGYQIILGVGRGLGLQMPIIAVQNTIPPAQLPIAMALLMFSQSFGAALFLSLAETIFTNSFKTLIPKYAPAVDPQLVISAGATRFRSFVTRTNLAGVLLAYAESIDRVFYMVAGMGVGCFAFAWGMGWKDLRKKKEVSNA